MEKHFVESNGEKIKFYLIRNEIKNINLKVDMNNNITVSIPMKMSLDIAKNIIKDKFNWIKKQQEYYNTFRDKKENITFENGETVYLLGKQYKMKVISDTLNNIVINNKYIELYIKEKYIQNKDYIRKIYEKWLRKYALDILEELVIKYQKLLNKYNIKLPKIEIRQMKSRWGSCVIDSNKLIFNLSLIKAPICCIEYVALHEMAHFKYANHSKEFYNFITIFMPDWKERKKILDEEFMGVVK